MTELNSTEKSALRARAHALNVVVSISENGISENVLKEIDNSLKAHELIKIRVFSEERAQREAYLSEICEKLNAAPVQHIGKLLVIWRASEQPVAAKKRNTRKEPRRTKRSFQGGTSES